MVGNPVCLANNSLTHTQVVCQFFLRGTCKFGDQCRNEHPQNVQSDRRSAFGGKFRSIYVANVLHSFYRFNMDSC